MYARKLCVLLRSESGARACPQKYLDSFAMRSFTGESRFDDTLPVGDGRLEAGALVPLDALRAALEDWFRRKSYLAAGEHVSLEEAS
ncbi:MAG TPA: hypothetical protein VN690_03565 [Terriglobales bacterium]|nr:hypothetical protein [Terriglobales bacterium]